MSQEPTKAALEAMARAAEARQERAELRRMVRGITKDKLTKSERLILEKLVNLWMTHRFGEGVIRPGRSRLAKQCDVHLDTVRVALARFRELSIIAPVAYAKGGTQATRYVVNLDVLRRLYGPAIPVSTPGKMIELNRRKSVGLEGQNPSVTPAENPSRTIREQQAGHFANDGTGNVVSLMRGKRHA
jgi:hypothetical protein